jgi:hypothetical protein
MRPLQAVAQVLFIASIANSTLAVPGSAPEEIIERRKWGPKDLMNLALPSMLQGLIGGIIGGFGSSGQRVIVNPNKTYALLLLLSLTLPLPPQTL